MRSGEREGKVKEREGKRGRGEGKNMGEKKRRGKENTR